jgi:hypothetical protein
MNYSSVPCRAPFYPVRDGEDDETVVIKVGSGYDKLTLELSVPWLCKHSGYFEER